MRKIIPDGGMNFMSRVKNQNELDLIVSAAELLAQQTGRDVTNADLLKAALENFIGAGGKMDKGSRPQM
jgi:hypothetical protein